MRTETNKIALLFLLMASVSACVSCRSGRQHASEETIKRQVTHKPAQQKGAVPQTASAIRGVDFKNFTYVIDGESYAFSNGEWTGANDMDTAQASVKSISFGPLMDNGRDQAVVVLTGNWGGGNLMSGQVQVFDFHGGQAWEVISLSGNKGEIKNKLLEIAYPEWAEEDPICCPTLQITETYRWNGLTFIKQRSVTQEAGE